MPDPSMLLQTLIKAGVEQSDAEALANEYANAQPSPFIHGLDVVARALATHSIDIVSPTESPWQELHLGMMNQPDFAQAFQASLLIFSAPLQVAISGAVTRRMGDFINGANRKAGKVKSDEIVKALAGLGYTFRMNACNDEMEVNNEPLSDPKESEIRVRMRDIGYDKVNMIRDVYVTEALKNKYHPIKDYLSSLSYDGGQYIKQLCSYFQDEHGIFELWLRKWLIGAVAKVLGDGKHQNPMLVLDGAQGLGKSRFVNWLCPSVLAQYFIESPINPDDKDSYVRLMSLWVWEVSELGATIKRADREALKHFITMGYVSVRKAFGRYDTRKPAMASLIGTVNNDTGILSDATGSRRFLVCHLLRIEWGYTQQINVDDIWAEAHAAYLGGEKWQLSPDEVLVRNEINELYEIDQPMDGFLKAHFDIDATRTDWFTASHEILLKLEGIGYKGTTQSNSRDLAQVMTRMGLKKMNKRIGGVGIRGYVGIQSKTIIP